MCYRYRFEIKDTKSGRQIKKRAEELNLVFKKGEIFPNDKVLCIIPKGSKIELAVKNFGIKARNLLVNARIETIDEKVSFKDIKDNHCAIVSSSFIEWDKDKKKYDITNGDEFMYLACIYNDKNELVMLTKDSYDKFKNIHDRIPVIMDKEEMLNFVHNKEILISDKKLDINCLSDEISLF